MQNSDELSVLSATVESMKEVQAKMVVVQEAVRLKHKENAHKLQGWIRLLQEANGLLERSIVTYEKTYMQVRIHYSVYLNLIEAKIGSFTPDGLAPNPYVEIWVDASRRARTRAIWVENAPVWNQTFDVMLHADAEELTFKLYSEAKDGLADPFFMGKADLLLEAFKHRPISTEWLPIQSRGLGHVTEASSIHALIKYKPGTKPSQGNLTVIIVEAKKLVEDGADLPSAYCRMSIVDQGNSKPTTSEEAEAKKDKSKEKDKSSKGEQAQKTTVVKKNDSPYWEEGFIFKLNLDPSFDPKLLIEVHDDRQSKQTFMGSVLIPISAITSDPSADSDLDRWFKLKRRTVKSDEPGNSALPQIGQLKLDMQYREERLLPDSFYDPLFDLFQEEHRFLISFCAKTAGNPTAKKEILKSLVGAFEMRNRSSWLLKAVSNAEVEETWDLSVLFRGNSVASSCLDIYMRTAGRQVLDTTLRPILRELWRSQKSCELDPVRITKGMDVKKNLAYFLETMNWIWDSIQNTLDKMPPTIRAALAHLRAKVSNKWPNDANAKYTAVTSFLFLRFFCPALMAPHSFDMVDEVPNASLSRNLALLSKTLMNLANFIQYGQKEPNLSPLNEWLVANFGKMREYIDRLVEDPDGVDTPILQNANATLFIYAREMNHLRDFLTQRRDKLEAEKSLVQDMVDAPVDTNGDDYDGDLPDLPGSASHLSPLAKHHNSDDEDDIVEDLMSGRKITNRKGFKRVSSKSRLADGKVTQQGGIVLGKEGYVDPTLRLAYVKLLDRTLSVLDGLNSSVLNHQPLSPANTSRMDRNKLVTSNPDLTSPRKGKPSDQIAEPSNVTVNSVPLLLAKPAPLFRAGSLESSTLHRKRAQTTKPN